MPPTHMLCVEYALPCVTNNQPFQKVKMLKKLRIYKDVYCTFGENVAFARRTQHNDIVSQISCYNTVVVYGRPA